MRVTLTGVGGTARSPEWPQWAKAVKLLASKGDAGVGDTIARVVGPIGGDAFKAWTKSVGFNCGCEKRQETLNARYPYDIQPVSAELRQSRLEQCRLCHKSEKHPSHITPEGLPKVGRCNESGLDIADIVAIKNQKCPLNKW